MTRGFGKVVTAAKQLKEMASRYVSERVALKLNYVNPDVTPSYESEPGLLMNQLFSFCLALLPLLFKLGQVVAPPAWFESYSYFSTDGLNIRPGEDEAKSGWRNMGWWEVSFTPYNRKSIEEDTGHGCVSRCRGSISEEAVAISRSRRRQRAR